MFAPAADPASPRITRPDPSPAPASVGAPPSGLAPSPFAWQSLDSGGGSLAASLAAAQQQAGAGTAQHAQAQAPPGVPAMQHERSESVVVLGSSAAGGSVFAPAAGARPGPSSDYLAALDSTATNPFEAPGAAAAQRAAAQREAAAAAAQQAASAAAAVQQGQQQGQQRDAKVAQKQELLQQVGDRHGLGAPGRPCC